MSGWIKIHRRMMSHWCSSDPNFLAVWLRLLFDANYESKKTLFNGVVVELKRGELIYGRNSYAKKTGVTISKLRRIINVLESEHMISQQKTNKYSIISITNYDQHQTVDQQKTSKTPTNNQQTTTPKELKNIIKERYNDYCKNSSWSKLLKITDARETALRNRLKDCEEFNVEFLDVLQIAYDSDFLRNGNGTWNCNFDFIIKKDNFLKIVEGKYSNQKNGNQSSSEPIFKDRKAELEDEYNHKIAYWLKNDHWPMEWGTEPTKEQHKVPHSVMKAHGLEDPNKKLH